MSRENVEVVRRFFDAYNARDESAWLQLIAHDFRFESAFAGFEGRAYEGPAGFARYFVDLDEAWSTFQVEPEAIRDAGPDRVIGYSRVHATGKGSGVAISPSITVVYRLRDGKIVELETFAGRAEAHEAVGLSE
jgi:ketosteroid isomerase-like protein